MSKDNTQLNSLGGTRKSQSIARDPGCAATVVTMATARLHRRYHHQLPFPVYPIPPTTTQLILFHGDFIG